MGPGYSREEDLYLMRSIHESCGAAIAEATGGNREWNALLAGIAANESRGCRSAFRFVPALYQELVALLNGSGPKVDGVTRPQLEKFLGAAGSEAERAALLKKLAGLHGYTHIPGYNAILWKAPLEALTEREGHFGLAVRLLERLSRDHQLDPAKDAAEIGRRWNGGRCCGRTQAAMYGWRLGERMRLYREIEGASSLSVSRRTADSSID